MRSGRHVDRNFEVVVGSAVVVSYTGGVVGSAAYGFFFGLVVTASVVTSSVVGSAVVGSGVVGSGSGAYGFLEGFFEGFFGFLDGFLAGGAYAFEGPSSSCSSSSPSSGLSGAYGSAVVLTGVGFFGF